MERRRFPICEQCICMLQIIAASYVHVCKLNVNCTALSL